VDVAFERVHHLVTVPVSVGGVERRFVLDTGIGVTLLAPELCRAAGGEETGLEFRGRRMSGQEVAVPLARVPSLRFGALERRDVEVGLLDLAGALPPEVAAVAGFLSLAYFAEHAFTVDYPRAVVVLESDRTRAVRLRDGIAVEVELVREGPSLDAFLPLVLPGGRAISVEVDMGSGTLILDDRLAPELGVGLDAPGVRRVDGRDETGGTFTRWFTKLEGNVHPAGAPELAQERPEAMFQRIVHDGLIGDAFLSRQPVTYDLASRQLVFGRLR
jgi:hypothetical protein